MKQQIPIELQIPFDRVTYRDGQLLTARDLHDDFQANQRLRRLHTRYLHDTWGIALGFIVTAQTGDDSVHLGPGYAIDSSAREILLAQDLRLPVPDTPSAADFMLVISYLDDSAFENLPSLGNICVGTGLDPRNERPVIGWRTPDTFRPGPDVPVAKIRVQQGALVAAPDLGVRRYATRMIRPHVGFGTMEFRPPRSEFYSAVAVDTSDAGFANTPQYFARLDWPSQGLPKDAGSLLTFAGNFAYIDAATPTGFTYNLPFVNIFATERTPKLEITWLGLERVSGCEPFANFRLIFTLAGMLFLNPRMSTRLPSAHFANIEKGVTG